MILDNVHNLRRYAALHPGIDAAAAFLKTITADTPCGKYVIDGDAVYAVVQRYKTRPEAELAWEYHEHYWDIQFIFSGNETILWSERGNVPGWSQYNIQNDSAVSRGDYASVPVCMTPGQFAIFAPQDAHKPKCCTHSTSDVLKVVVKLRCI